MWQEKDNFVQSQMEALGESGDNNHGNQASGACCGGFVTKGFSASYSTIAQGGGSVGYSGSSCTPIAL